MILNGDADMLVRTLILPILRGADARVTDDGVQGGCGPNCNAVSVCLPFQARAARIMGVSPAD